MFCAANMFCAAVTFDVFNFHLFQCCFVLSTSLQHKSLLKTSKYFDVLCCMQHKTSPIKVNGRQQKILTFLTKFISFGPLLLADPFNPFASKTIPHRNTERLYSI